MFKKIKETELYRGSSIRFCIDRVILPSGQEMDQAALRHPGSVVVLPLLDPNTILLLKQYRYIIDREIYEIPAGKLEGDENPKEAANRELIEETGYKASEMIPILEIYPTPGYIDEKMHLFLGTTLTPAEQNLELDEIIHVKTVTLDEAFRMINEGSIMDGKTIISLLLARERRLI